MLGFTTKKENRKDWKRFELYWRGFELFEWLKAGESKRGHKVHRRISFLTAITLHLFTGYQNYLGGRGWEFSVGTLRYCPSFLRRWIQWSFGWGVSGRRGRYFGGGDSCYIIHNLGRFAWVNTSFQAQRRNHKRWMKEYEAQYEQYGPII